MSLAFTPRVCQTGENTGDVLGSLVAITDGSLIDPFDVCPAPPPIGQAVLMPMIPPQIGNWLPTPPCIVRSGDVADRPAPGCVDPCGCRFFWAEDEEILYFDDCTDWQPIGGVCVLEGHANERPASGSQPCSFYYDLDNEILSYDDIENGVWKNITGKFDEATALQVGECEDSVDADEDPDAPTDYADPAWDINNQTMDASDIITEEGVVINVISRVVYKTEDDGGSEILYGYCRQLGFDTGGRLVAVSEEMQFIIDEPEPCTGTSSSASPAP